MNVSGEKNKIRVAIVQRVIFHYRLGFFERIAREWDLKIFHGKSVPGSKVINAPPPYSFPHKEIFTLCKRSKKNPRQILYFNPSLVYNLIRWKPDLLILEGSNNVLNNIFIYFYVRLFSKKYIWWGIGQVPGRNDSFYRKLLTPARKYLIRNAACCFAYCELSAQYFQSITASRKVRVLPNSIDNEIIEQELEHISETEKQKLRHKLGLSQDSIVLLFVGAMELNKRLDVFIEALKMLEDDGCNIHGLVVGSGGAENHYRKLASESGVRCQFLGKIIEGVNIFFQIADIFVLPGRGGLAINQAMVNGLPVVCNTPADGTEIDMIENGSNGYLIEDMDSVELVAVLRKMMKNRRYIEMGQKASEFVIQSYNINAMMDVVRRTITDLTAESPND